MSGHSQWPGRTLLLDGRSFGSPLTAATPARGRGRIRQTASGQPFRGNATNSGPDSRHCQGIGLRVTSRTYRVPRYLRMDSLGADASRCLSLSAVFQTSAWIASHFASSAAL